LPVVSHVAPSDDEYLGSRYDLTVIKQVRRVHLPAWIDLRSSVRLVLVLVDVDLVDRACLFE